jgi:hypothetical protein
MWRPKRRRYICSRYRIQWLVRRFAGFQRNLDETAHLRDGALLLQVVDKGAEKPT